MIVRFHSNLLGYKVGDVADIPADTLGLKDAIEGGYVSKEKASALQGEGAQPE